MPYKMHFTFFADASRKQNAERLFSKIRKEISIVDLDFESIDSYHKGGHTIRASCLISTDDWVGVVFEGIKIIQSLAHGWILSGSISESLEAVSNDVMFSGINTVSVSVKKK